jgi:uncharacterized membrane protein YfcA
VSALRVVWLLLTGLGAGLAGSVAGIASVVAYPALLALGLTPVAANVTSTVANVFGGLGSSIGSRPELAGQRSRLVRLVAACTAGGALGSALLLATPGHVFARVVPWLIGAASVAALFRPARGAPGRERRGPAVLTATSFAIAVYAGYFGAAAGVVMVVAVVHLAAETVPRATGTKNVSMMAANAVAALAFVAFGPVQWAAVVPLAAGFLAGGRTGPLVVRRVPPVILRLLIAAGGLALAIHLGLAAYR